LAALANWVALDDSRELAHLLVGVKRSRTQPPASLPASRSAYPRVSIKSVARLQDIAKLTRPMPIDAFIIEEGVATATPFIRVEVRPTMPPNFDDEGRRQVRQGRSTRALTDEELLQIYLTREGRSFAVRFQEASRALQEAVGGIGSQVESIADAIERNIAEPLAELTETAGYAASAASAAEDAATTVSRDVYEFERLVVLPTYVGDAARRRDMCVVDDGWSLRRAAERFQTSPQTAGRWAARYRRRDQSRPAIEAMTDRPSRPRRSPRATRRPLVRKICHLRRKRGWGPARIAHRLGMPASTVHRVLCREEEPRPREVDLATRRRLRGQVRRYEHAHPGDLIHVDVKTAAVRGSAGRPSVTGAPF
jgi:transposase